MIPQVIHASHLETSGLERAYLHTKTNDGHNNGRQEKKSLFTLNHNPSVSSPDSDSREQGHASRPCPLQTPE